jgi:hypothetical protein
MTDEERLTPFPALAEPAKMPPLKRYRVWFQSVALTVGRLGVDSFVLERPVPQWQVQQTLRDNGHVLPNGYWVAPAAILGLQTEGDDDEGVDQ